MRSSLLALAIIISGMSGSLQASKSAHAATHKVRRGETAARIARDNGLTLADLASLNPHVNLAKLAVGTAVKVQAPAVKAQAHALARKAAHPMPSLPATPALGPSSLTHLERILPSPVRDLSAQADAAGRSVLEDLKPVLPEARQDLTAAQGPEGPAAFEPVNRDRIDLLWPVETRTVSSAWGPRMRSKTVRVKATRRRIHYRGGHKGVDLTAPMGTAVFAALDGRVVVSGKARGYGNYVVLDHGNGIQTLYGHHNRNLVVEGEIVRRGQKIAEVGRTGNATGPHLHFELHDGGAPKNPLPYLNELEEIPADQVALNQAVAAPRTRP